MIGRTQTLRSKGAKALAAAALAALGLLILALTGAGNGETGGPLEARGATDDPSGAGPTPRHAELSADAADGAGAAVPATARAEAPRALEDGPPGRLRFRVLTPDGEPATRRLIAQASWLERARPLEADSRGGCVLDLAAVSEDEPTGRRGLPAPGSSVTLTVVQAAETARRRGPGEATLGPSVAASFSWPEAGRDVDLGVLLLAHAPLLVGGRFLGLDGAPVAPNGAVRWSVQGIDAAGVIGADMAEGDAFYAVVGDDGSFALHGPPAAGPGLRLSLRDDVQQTFEPVTTNPGRRGFDVNVIPTSRIQARVQVRGPVRPDHIRVDVVDGQDPSATWPSRVRTVWRDMPAWTSLLVIDVKPGTHHVVFSHDGSELLRLPNVAFPAGRASEDPRLAALEILTR
jgi:hypothetical protein